MDSHASLSPLATVCIREAAEQVRDVPSLKALGLVLDMMELRRAGFVTNDVPLYEIRAFIERRITTLERR
jgi:hypothetical protein